MALDIEQIRQDFPILQQKIYGKPVIYFDNGATTQKPQCVINEVVRLYSQINSNIHRGVHYFSQQTTEAYENARITVKDYINAKYKHEIVFTKGTTESINLVAYSFGEKYIKEHDEIIISEMEHHSNIVPWQLLCERKKSHLKIIPFNDQGELMIDKLDELITEKTKLISVTYISNSLGTINPVKTIIEKAHSKNVPVMIDAAQAIQHLKIDVQEIDCDFLVFSGHKIYAETGIGVLYAKEKFLEEMPPYQGGGDMIKTVSFEKTTYADLPFKFEAGTSNYIAAISLDTALKYLQKQNLEAIWDYETELFDYAQSQISQLDGLRIFGTAQHKASVISFLLKGIHHYDTGMILDKMGIAVRTGTHCTQPVMDHFKIEGTVRASFSFYNTRNEIDTFCEAIKKVIDMFG